MSDLAFLDRGELEAVLHEFCIRTGCHVRTSHVYPPIPCRDNDWCVYVDGDEEAQRYGWGATKEDAIRDFLDNYADEYEPGVAA